MIDQQEDVIHRLDRIEQMLRDLLEKETLKEWYSTAEVAKILMKTELTVREWCRLGRVHAEKRECGRGTSQEWIISHQELNRIRNEGLLPQPHSTRFWALATRNLAH